MTRTLSPVQPPKSEDAQAVGSSPTWSKDISSELLRQIYASRRARREAQSSTEPPPSGQSRVPRSAAHRIMALSPRLAIDVTVGLCLLFGLCRTFITEAYTVSTGSMAPTLLGWHRSVTCPVCGHPFSVGFEDQSVRRRADCHNCGTTEIDITGAPQVAGDRLLVSKFAYWTRAPRRWETALFRSPEDSRVTYVKRIVGLPRETLEIRAGDIYANGMICRKELLQQRAMRVLVHDQSHQSPDASWHERWRPREESCWNSFGTGLRFDGIEEPEQTSWLDYHHYIRQLKKEVPIGDSYAYNGRRERRTLHVVRDIMVELQLEVRKGHGKFFILLADGADEFVCEFWPTRQQARLLHNDQTRLTTTACPVTHSEPAHVEMALMDQRVTVAVNGQLLFGRHYDFERPKRPAEVPPPHPVALGCQEVTGRLWKLKLFRDVHYIDRAELRTHLPDVAPVRYRLGEGEYFMLGDNSPFSHDSRFFAGTHAVSRTHLIGKPYLVHFSSQPAQMSLGAWVWNYSLPNWSRIRCLP